MACEQVGVRTLVLAFLFGVLHIIQGRSQVFQKHLSQHELPHSFAGYEEKRQHVSIHIATIPVYTRHTDLPIWMEIV